MNTQKIISIWAKALALARGGRSEREGKEIVQRLSQILKQKKRDYLLPKILKKAEKILLRRRGIELTLAKEQKTGLTEKIKEKLLKIFGQDKEIEIKIEKEMLGGFKVKTESILIKATIKDFLDLLKERARS